VIAKGVAQQVGNEIAGNRGLIPIGSFELPLESAPLGDSDLEGATVLVLQLEAGRDLIVGLGLMLGLS
jgi:hypothetical protein